MASARALVHMPANAKRGDVIEVRAIIAHVMEAGHRPDALGKLVPRDIVTRFECRLDGALVVAVELYPAVAANPCLAFRLRVDKPGTLVFTWEGDRGFRHVETVALSTTQ